MMRSNEHERLQELLADRALGGLRRDQERELSRLGAPLEERAERGPDSYELAAAAIHLALTDTPTPLPPELRRRVEETARRTLDPTTE